MSEAGYDRETCQSCQWWYNDDDGDGGPIGCIHPLEKQNDGPAGRICKRFRASLQCRQVRAEEEANKLRRERNGLLGRIATALGRATVHLEAIAEDQASANEPDQRSTVDFRDGRCVHCNGTGTVNKGTTGECACCDCGGIGKVCG